MSPRVFHALVTALIRIGLLLALVIMLMAENAQAQPVLRPAAAFAAAVPWSTSAQYPTS